MRTVASDMFTTTTPSEEATAFLDMATTAQLELSANLTFCPAITDASPGHPCHTAAGGDRFQRMESTDAARRSSEAAASVRASVIGSDRRCCSAHRRHHGPFAAIRHNGGHSPGVELLRRHPFFSEEDASAGVAFITDLLLAVRATGYRTNKREVSAAFRRMCKTDWNVTERISGTTASPLRGGLPTRLHFWGMN